MTWLHAADLALAALTGAAIGLHTVRPRRRARR